jgi:hypothetical protein
LAARDGRQCTHVDAGLKPPRQLYRSLLKQAEFYCYMREESMLYELVQQIQASPFRDFVESALRL